MSADEKKMIELRSSDGELFQVEEKVALLSLTIKNLVDDGYGDSVVPLPNVAAKTLAKVLEYCKIHVEAMEKKKDSTVKKKELDEFEAELVKGERGELIALIEAADYMNIQGLIDISCQATADRIKDMTVEQVREYFNITNDFTPEEEEEVRRENFSVFD